MTRARRFPRLAASALALALPLAARAADTPATPPPDANGVIVLSLEDALRLAAERNSDIARARQYQEYVRGRYVEERAAALPQLTLDASHMKADDKTQAIFADAFTGGEGGGAGISFPTSQTTRTADIGLTQALFTWGQVGAAIRAAKFGMQSAEDELRLARQATARDTTASFHDVLLARELSAIAHQNVDQRQRQLDEAQRKLAAGTATDYDVLAAQVALDNARPAAIRADNAVQGARDRLRFILALGRGTEVDVRGRLAAEPGPAPAYPASLDTALQKRPDLADAAHRKDVYKELVTIAKAGNKPRLDFRGAWGWKDWDLGIARSRGKTWNAGVYFHFPFFDGLRTSGRVREAASDYATQEIAESTLRNQVALEVRQAVDALSESGEIVRALSGTVTQAERLLQMAEKGYQLGVKTRLDVDDAQLNLMQAKGNLARAQRDWLVAEVTYRYVTGTLD